MAKPLVFSIPKPPPEPPLLRINNFRGINKAVTATEIADNESPSMLNMHCSLGTPDSRTGYERVFSTSLGVGKMNGAYPYRKADGSTIKLLHHGTILYTQTGSAQPVSIYTSMNNAQSRGFDFGGKKYILDGANYLVYDGTTVAAVTPYVPTLTVSTPPAGGGTPLEDFNLIGAGFKQQFSGNAIATFQLALTNLDATAVTAKVGGVAKAETTDFTVSRATGVVTFTTAPPAGTNNVEITAYKTQTGYPDRIKKCKLASVYGGTNDTRVFAALNPDFPAQEWRCGVGDPTYWPENGFYTQGNNAIKGFAKHYDTQIILKEPAPGQTTIWNQQFTLDSTGKVSFPLKPVNDQIGCIATDSIQTIENEPTFLDRSGVYKLTSSMVRDERNVVPVSRNINEKLLSEPNLANAVSFDFDQKYWLCVNGNVYVLDYRRKDQYDPYGIWYIYDNIHASVFMEQDGNLYFGSDSQGLLYRFKKDTEQYPYNDDGAAINRYMYTKEFAFGADERKKMVEKVFNTLLPYERASVDIYYITNKKESALVKQNRMDLTDYALMDYSTFSYMTRKFPQEASAKIKAKKITHFQLLFKNNKLDDRMTISAVAIKYRYQSEIK